MKETYAQKKIILVKEKRKVKINKVKIAKSCKALSKNSTSGENSKNMIDTERKETEQDQIKELVMKNFVQDSINVKKEVSTIDETHQSIFSPDSLILKKYQTPKFLNSRVTPNEIKSEYPLTIGEKNNPPPIFSTLTPHSFQSQMNAHFNQIKPNIINVNTINSLSDAKPELNNNASSMIESLLVQSKNISNIRALNLFNQQDFQKIESHRLFNEKLGKSNIEAVNLLNQKSDMSNIRIANQFLNPISQQIESMNLFFPSFNSFQQPINNVTNQNVSNFSELAKLNAFIERTTLIDNMNFLNAKMAGNLPNFSRYNKK